jgi:hypothetical protein
LLSLAIVLIGGPRWSGIAGFAYGLIGPAISIHLRRRKKLRLAMTPSRATVVA